MCSTLLHSHMKEAKLNQGCTWGTASLYDSYTATPAQSPLNFLCVLVFGSQPLPKWKEKKLKKLNRKRREKSERPKVRMTVRDRDGERERKGERERRGERGGGRLRHHARMDNVIRQSGTGTLPYLLHARMTPHSLAYACVSNPK